jgi:hypothetical protein
MALSFASGDQPTRGCGQRVGKDARMSAIAEVQIAAVKLRARSKKVVVLPVAGGPKLVAMSVI